METSLDTFEVIPKSIADEFESFTGEEIEDLKKWQREGNNKSSAYEKLATICDRNEYYILLILENLEFVLYNVGKVIHPESKPLNNEELIGGFVLYGEDKEFNPATGKVNPIEKKQVEEATGGWFGGWF